LREGFLAIILSSDLSMCGKVGSLCCSNLWGVSGNTVHDDRNPGKRTGVNTAIGTIVWCGCCSSGGGVVCGEVGGFSGSDFWGVLDGQGCHVGKSGGVGVPVVSWPSVHHGDGGQAEKRDLKRDNPDML
jgi:hypothetical protein